ncbi:uncharacterized protein LOC130957823 [Arachis stenosperma]|uniref:uncharacterized protein LOC130957823 n=1 Tax=Arachis stenosperma TaxID=217475 RepID=UPI0025AC32E5|nr:uncharacterized protein LOC130957823 [Arachis stenosperma]
MALDANNHVFVIAYAVTRAENTENWTWFLTRLQDDLGDHQVRGWNLMSDQQKGLMRAAKEVMPYAHHRNCVLHIWKNLQQRFNNKQVKGLLWHAAKCTTQVQFKAAMEKFKSVCHGGWEYMNQFDPAGGYMGVHGSTWEFMERIVSKVQGAISPNYVGQKSRWTSD